jgi:hypothetical protein
MSRGLLMALALLLALSACGPQVVAGNERTVTVKAGPIGNIETVWSLASDGGRAGNLPRAWTGGAG